MPETPERWRSAGVACNLPEAPRGNLNSNLQWQHMTICHKSCSQLRKEAASLLASHTEPHESDVGIWHGKEGASVWSPCADVASAGGKHTTPRLPPAPNCVCRNDLNREDEWAMNSWNSDWRRLLLAVQFRRHADPDMSDKLSLKWGVPQVRTVLKRDQWSALRWPEFNAGNT